jgi:hypothetical protein
MINILTTSSISDIIEVQSLKRGLLDKVFKYPTCEFNKAEAECKGNRNVDDDSREERYKGVERGEPLFPV